MPQQLLLELRKCHLDAFGCIRNLKAQRVKLMCEIESLSSEYKSGSMTSACHPCDLLAEKVRQTFTLVLFC